MRQNVIVNGMTVNDRAKLLADALGLSCSRMAAMLLKDQSYFSNCAGRRTPMQTIKTANAIFPGLDARWLYDGEGECDLSQVRAPKYLVELTRYNTRQFVNIFKNGTPELIRQYLSDNNVPIVEFVQLYGRVYPTLLQFIDPTATPQQPSVVRDIRTYMPEEQSPLNHQPSTTKLVDTIASLTATIAAMQETIASQQKTINLLTSQLEKSAE